MDTLKQVRIPTYLDGKPTNLQAAIVDAEYWLRWLRNQINETDAGAKQVASRGLRQAIRVLEGFLPEDEEAPQLTPTQQAKVNLIKEKLRARQQKIAEILK